MKYTFFLLLTFSTIKLFAQAPFAGEIKYSVRSSMVLHGSMKKDDSYIFIQFGINKIKFRFVESQTEKDPPYTLIYLDSGKVYSVDPKSQTYIYHRLSEWKTGADVPPTKTIAGFSTQSTSINEIDISGQLSNLLSPKTIFYVADNLVYPIPEKYSGNAELLMIQKGKIVLGSNFYFSFNTFNFQVDDDEEKKINESNFATIEAIEVVTKKVDENTFSIPSNYKIRRRDDFNSNIDSLQIDSTVQTTDSVPNKPSKTIRKKQNKKENSKQIITKKSAIRRKDD